MRRYRQSVGMVVFLLLAAGVLYLAWKMYREQVVPSDADIHEKVIPAAAWAGLERCELSSALFEIQNSLLKDAAPLRKEDGIWSYRISGQFLGLQAQEMEIGVCQLTGTRDCGWGSYVGIVVAAPYPEARQSLQSRYGIDFTQELRDDEAEATMRPILSEEKRAGRSRLHCDPGTL